MTSEGRMQKHNAIGKQKLFFGGIPTEPDITALKESFPASTLKPGVLVSYQDIEKVISCAIRSNRFRTVVNRWREELEKDGGIVTRCQNGVGVLVLSDSGKLDYAGDKFRSAARLVRRSSRIVARIDVQNLDESERDRLLKLEKRNAAVELIAASRRPLELPQI